MEEIFKDIKNYEGLYQISNLGNVKSLERKVHGRLMKEHLLKQHNNGKGYMNVDLWKENKGKLFYVHRLVAEAFIPNIDNKKEVDHINTLRDDNRVENLRWVTSSENNLNLITNQKMKNAPHTGALGEKNGANTHPENNVFCNGRYNALFKGTHYYNNGEVEVRVFTCPEGFTKGRLSSCFGRKYKGVKYVGN